MSVTDKSIHCHAPSTFLLPLPWSPICLWPIQLKYSLNLFANPFHWLMQTSGCWEQGCKVCVEVQIQAVVGAAGSWEDPSRDPTVASQAERAGYSLSCSRTMRRPGMIPNTGAIWTWKLWLLQIWRICLCLLQKGKKTTKIWKLRQIFCSYFTAEKFWGVFFFAVISKDPWLHSGSHICTPLRTQMDFILISLSVACLIAKGNRHVFKPRIPSHKQYVLLSLEWQSQVLTGKMKCLGQLKSLMSSGFPPGQTGECAKPHWYSQGQVQLWPMKAVRENHYLAE